MCVTVTRITLVYVYAATTDATRFARGVGAVVVYVYVYVSMNHAVIRTRMASR